VKSEERGWRTRKAFPSCIQVQLPNKSRGDVILVMPAFEGLQFLHSEAPSTGIAMITYRVRFTFNGRHRTIIQCLAFVAGGNSYS
jgi:hypothetical protein